MDNKSKNVVVALLLAVVLSIVNVVLYNLFEEGDIQRFLKFMGGDFLSGGYIQMLTFFAFFWAMGEVLKYTKSIKYQYESMGKKFLPENKIFVFSPDDVSKLKLEMIEQEEQMTKSSKASFWLLQIIRKACVKFDNTKQVGEVIEVVTSQVRISKEKVESKLSMVRYLIWAIPSIGFIGTVLGIGMALGSAYKVQQSDEGINVVTDLLGVAFDTTLLALLLSLIIMFLHNRLEQKQEMLHSDMEEYLTDNLINRIVLD